MIGIMNKRLLFYIACMGLKADVPDRDFLFTKYAVLENFIEAPYTLLAQENVHIPNDFQNDGIQGEHVRIALSNLAEGCEHMGSSQSKYHPVARDCLETVVDVALNPQLSPYGQSIDSVDQLGDHGIYLSHLNIVLGSWKRLTGDDTYLPLNKRISEHLAQRSLQAENKQVASYESMAYRWPADQTATLYSLFLFDQNYGTHHSEKPINEWLDYIRNSGTDAKTGLPVSEVTGIYPHAAFPRGCAISWSVRYMAYFAPNEAQALWKTYKSEFEQTYPLVVGFREWPRNINLTEDVDSGPILFGNGVAATAFAVGASNAVGDKKTYAALQRTEFVGEVGVEVLALFGRSSEQEIKDSFLAQAIQFNMHSQQ